MDSQSSANVAKIIHVSSDPKTWTVELGGARGWQVLFAEKQFHADNDDDECMYMFCGVAIFSSDFKRARETAQHTCMADACSCL
jgi:hypothetical protein